MNDLLTVTLCLGAGFLAGLIIFQHDHYDCEKLPLPETEEVVVEYSPPAPGAMEYKNWWNE